MRRSGGMSLALMGRIVASGGIFVGRGGRWRVVSTGLTDPSGEDSGGCTAGADEVLMLLEGGGAYFGALVWKNDRMDDCAAGGLVVGRDMVVKTIVIFRRVKES